MPDVEHLAKLLKSLKHSGFRMFLAKQKISHLIYQIQLTHKVCLRWPSAKTLVEYGEGDIPAYAEDRPDKALALRPRSIISLAESLLAEAVLPFNVTKITPKAKTGSEAHCMGVKYWPSSHTAKTAVGKILKLWEHIWKVTASKWEAATITRICIQWIFEEQVLDFKRTEKDLHRTDSLHIGSIETDAVRESKFPLTILHICNAWTMRQDYCTFPILTSRKRKALRNSASFRAFTIVLRPLKQEFATLLLTLPFFVSIDLCKAWAEIQSHRNRSVKGL